LIIDVACGANSVAATCVTSDPVYASYAGTVVRFLKLAATCHRRIEGSTAFGLASGRHPMDPVVMRFAEMVAIFVAMCGVLGVGALAFSLVSRLVARVQLPLPAAKADDQRMARLEQAVDTIAVEVERISESQRFISRLMDERSKEPAKLP
jgi:hypothetical protein